MSAIFSLQAAETEMYLGGKLGNTWLDDSCYVGSSCDDSSLSGGIYLGHNYSEHLGVELGLDMLGSFTSSFNDNGTAAVIDDDAHAVSLAPKLSLPLDEVSLFAKLGAAHVDYGHVDDLVLLTALGAEIAVSSDWAVRLEYQRLNNVEEGYVDDMDVDSLSLGFTYSPGSKDAMPAVMPEPAPVAEPEPAPAVEPEPAPAPEPKPKPVTKLFKEFGTELFDTNSYRLAEGSAQYFDWLVGVMQKYPQAKASIVGHTDSRGSAAYNQTLSENRAQAVADYLISQGIEAERIEVTGAGETQPKASNDSAEGRMANRRVEVTIDEFEYQE
jgi:OOP family OmpA-OmpF porin